MSTEIIAAMAKAVAEGDALKVAEFIRMGVDERDYTVIKCEGCGEVVAVDGTRGMLGAMLMQESAPFKYLVLKHMAECPRHNVCLSLTAGAKLPISQALEANIRRVAEAHGVDYAADLPNVVERWRLKCLP